MEVMLKQNENLKVVEEEHEQLKIAFAEQSQRSVGRFTFLVWRGHDFLIRDGHLFL